MQADFEFKWDVRLGYEGGGILAIKGTTFQALRADRSFLLALALQLRYLLEGKSGESSR